MFSLNTHLLQCSTFWHQKIEQINESPVQSQFKRNLFRKRIKIQRIFRRKFQWKIIFMWTRGRRQSHRLTTHKKNRKKLNASWSIRNQANNCLGPKPKKSTKILSLPDAHFVKLIDFEKDSVVLAKQKWSTPWPSWVERIDKNRVLVYFFGDKRFGYVNKTEIYDFILSVNAVKSVIAAKTIAYYQSYVTGIAEVEFLLGIASADCFFNWKWTFTGEYIHWYFACMYYCCCTIKKTSLSFSFHLVSVNKVWDVG